MMIGDLASQTAVVMLCSYHVMVIIRQRLYMSGDVELNPGPLDQGSSAILVYDTDSKSQNIIIICS